jgi:adenosylcobinamide-phosphate synthase
MSFGLALMAGAVDAAVGYPNILYRAIGHPVTWMGRFITWADGQWNSEQDPPDQRRLHGVLLVVALLILSLLSGLAIAWLCRAALPPLLAFIAIAILASSLVAQRSLYEHVEAVADALGHGLAQGREAVAMIVGRDTSELDEAGVCRAAIESLAESFCDGIVAPLFWLALAGLPGGIACKAINTADSMIGHKTDRYIDFGWAAARTDDGRELAGGAACRAVAGAGRVLVPRASPGQALAVAWRDAGKHDSPNAGWPEAAMAGALGLRLVGPSSYEGEIVQKGWMGDGRSGLKAADIRTALDLYRAACGVQLGLLAILLGFTFL